jgi:signal transduction histidine kinase
MLNGNGAHDQALLEQAALLDGRLAYLMTWTSDGLVVADTRRAQVGTFLDPAKWPALDPAQASRTAVLGNPEVLELTSRLTGEEQGEAPGGGAQPETLPRGAVFLSVAYLKGDLDRQFWESAAPLLVGAGIFTGAGALLLAVLILVAYRRLESTQREIEQTARARTSLLTERGMLASVLAHEVRSPLTALRFNLHALRGLIMSIQPQVPENVEASSPPSPGAVDKRLELTDRCEREIRRLDGMLNDFLLRTQVHAEPVPASLNTVIREAVEFLTPALEERKIRISLHLDAADPHVHVHPDELRQVILNLAANAMDAMPPPKGGTLAISTVAPSADADARDGNGAEAGLASAPHQEGADAPAAPITLLIRDSGTGIPGEQLERIFEPFFSTKPNGSGLGLTLVRRVISGAGGTLFVESTTASGSGTAASGTTFRILLPPVNTQAPAGRGYAHKRGGAAGPGGEHI